MKKLLSNGLVAKKKLMKYWQDTSMAKTPKVVVAKAGENPGRIIDIDVASEMSESFLEYAYSVIYSRALPDARDGLKASTTSHLASDECDGTSAR